MQTGLPILPGYFRGTEGLIDWPEVVAGCISIRRDPSSSGDRWVALYDTEQRPGRSPQHLQLCPFSCRYVRSDSTSDNWLHKARDSCPDLPKLSKPAASALGGAHRLQRPKVPESRGLMLLCHGPRSLELQSLKRGVEMDAGLCNFQHCRA